MLHILWTVEPSTDDVEKEDCSCSSCGHGKQEQNFLCLIDVYLSKFISKYKCDE